MRRPHYQKYGVLIMASLWLVSAVVTEAKDLLLGATKPKWQATERGFSAYLVITAKPEIFFKEWDTTPKEHAPRLYFDETVRRGSTVTGLVAFTGSYADTNGHCNIAVKYRVLRPDGTVYADLAGNLCKDKNGPPPGYFDIGDTLLGFKVELADPLGDYRVEAKVLDKNAEIELPLVWVLHVLPANMAPHF